jgi:mono/diheme cytochrome c family protein
MYIQEYGLGRLIGPKPNWSGVFRSDEWLMEHFRNPAGHVPRSIMPILPFDDSKFYALTYMLDVLGRKNRDSVRDIWQNRGFNPEQAFNIHCAQCHGDYLQGNGPVATWIYPIPKNLRNAEFLRNLTKEEAYRSIMHGVKGTPMPPWGETPIDKSDYDGIPVLTHEEANKLVDWLYTSLPGATVIKGVQDVPKWQYTPKDVIEELQREGMPLKPGKARGKQESSSLPPKTPATVGFGVRQLPQELLLLFPKGDHYYASLTSKVATVDNADEQQEVDKIFDTVPNPNPGEGKYAYFIKKAYYTDSNIGQGKKFFEMNCASCHGKEADGSGMRASIMFDAKPRMLTNLDWIKMHDDIRLLRSIKYGVPGTAMTPWGDQTSALQRLQLVIFIRSLTEEKDLREILSETLYRSFESTDAQIEMARALTYPTLEALEAQSKQIRSKQVSEDITNKGGETALYSEALKLYEEQLKLAAQEKDWEALDQQLLALKALVKKERDIYLSIGDMLIALRPNESWTRFLKAAAFNENTFVFRDKILQMPNDPVKDKERMLLLEAIVSELTEENTALNKEIAHLPENQQAVLKAKADQYYQAKNKVLVALEQLKVLRQQEAELFKAYQKKLKALSRP